MYDKYRNENTCVADKLDMQHIINRVWSKQVVLLAAVAVAF